MKKSLLICMFSALAVGTLVTSCSDDNNGNEPELIVCPVDGTTFTDVNGLVLTYSGQPMIGKQVVFTPSTTESGKATLVLSGASTGSLPVSLQSKADATVPVAGVIPGETSTTIEILYKVDGDKITFDGEDTKDGRVIKYSGEALDGSMTLNLEVTMPENELAGTSWNLQAYDNVEYQTSPIHFVWEADKKIEIFQGVELTVNEIVLMALRLPVIGGEITANDALIQILNEVSFNADGNIVAKYKNNLTETEYSTSPLNIAMYTVPSASELRVYLNLAQIMANVSTSPASKATQMEIMSNLLTMVMPMLSQGVPVSYTIVDGQMTAYLNSDVMIPLLKAVSPLFTDPEFIQMIVDMVKNDPTMGAMAGMIEPIIAQLPEVISSTTKFEAGINMVKK